MVGRIVRPSLNRGSASAFVASVLGNLLTTRGDMIRRGSSAVERMALGATGAPIGSDGTDLDYLTAAEVRTYLGIPTTTTDNAAARFNGTAGAMQNSSFIIDDSGHVSSFGGNIVFPATQASSGGANTLDDYEEGLFTPAITLGGAAVGVTYSAQTGTYTKIGRTVVYNALVNLTSKGSSTGVLLITGLPFTSAASAPICVRHSGLTAGVGDTTLMGFVTSTSIRLEDIGTGNATQLTDVDITNTSSLLAGGVYNV